MLSCMTNLAYISLSNYLNLYFYFLLLFLPFWLVGCCLYFLSPLYFLLYFLFPGPLVVLQRKTNSLLPSVYHFCFFTSFLSLFSFFCGWEAGCWWRACMLSSWALWNICKTHVACMTKSDLGKSSFFTSFLCSLYFLLYFLFCLTAFFSFSTSLFNLSKCIHHINEVKIIVKCLKCE